MEQQIEPRLYRAEDIADRLSVSVRTVKRWVLEGKFPKPLISDGNFIRWSLEQLVTWVKEVIEGARTTA